MEPIEFTPDFEANVRLVEEAMGYPFSMEPISALEFEMGKTGTKLIITRAVHPAVRQFMHYLICVAAGLAPDSTAIVDQVWVLGEEHRSLAKAFAALKPDPAEENRHFFLAFWYFCLLAEERLSVRVLTPSCAT